MSAATASAAVMSSTPAREFRRPRPGWDEYDLVDDPAVCLHLPADECDHTVFRCARCCRHEE